MGVVWGSCGGRVGVVWGSCGGHVGVVWGSCGGRGVVMGVRDIPRIDSLSIIQFRTLCVQTGQASCFKNLTLGFSFKQTPIIPLTHTNKLIMTESQPFNPPTLKYWHIYNSTVNNPVFPMYCQPFPTQQPIRHLVRSYSLWVPNESL